MPAAIPTSTLAERARQLRLPPWAVRTGVRLILRPVLGPRVPVRLQRLVPEVNGLVTPLPAGTRVTRAILGGVPGLRVDAHNADPTRGVLYLHGGGYVTGSARTHRGLAAGLSRAAGAPVHVVEYRLAPEHRFPAALDDALAAYQALLRDVGDARLLAVGGDSAGGGLALALALRLRERGLPLPAVLLLLCPWVDLTLSGASIIEVAPRDPMLRPAWLRTTAGWYRGDQDPRLPELSPLESDLSGLPAIVMHAAGDDVLVSDAERLADRARAAGVSVDYQRFDGLWHDFHGHAGLLREADDALERAGRAVGALLRPPARSHGGGSH